ncbi:MAG: hypothetical protein GC160_24690 [Acidobacteria bacterium]|nr:hypothetical protein [Acidobacteriota bacterium]
MSGAGGRREEYETTGMVRRALPLADRSGIPALIEEAELFDAAIARFRRRGQLRRVPYLATPAIRRVSRDPGLLGAVGAILGGGPWVMWGANIRRDVPNQASLWHVDAESALWPTLTVVIGLRGCHAGNATRYIPHSQRLGVNPPALPESDGAAVVEAAAALDRRCDRVETFEGFGDGGFYLFNAAGWHCGEPTASAGRVLLFLHYQRADEPRIPYMWDYGQGLWLDYPAPYVASQPGENKALQPIPRGKGASRRTLRGWFRRLRHGGGSL